MEHQKVRLRDNARRVANKHLRTHVIVCQSRYEIKMLNDLTKEKGGWTVRGWSHTRNKVYNPVIAQTRGLLGFQPRLMSERDRVSLISGLFQSWRIISGDLPVSSL